jgi:tetratricopeptide (TPR) repeat protein
MAGPGVNYQAGSIEAGLANGEKLLAANPSAAALQAQTLLRSAPQNAAAYRLLAKAMALLGKPEEARQARAQAVQNSRHVTAIVEAHRATREGRASQVEAMLKDHLARYPDDPVALMVNGEALAQVGRTTEAVRQLEAALTVMPEYREAGMALVRAQQQRFDIAAALQALQPLIASKPGDVALLRWRASLLSNLGDNATAAEILGLLTQARPEMPELWISLGDELRTLGRSDEAQAAYRRALEGRPGFGAAWWSLAALRHVPFDEADRRAMLAALAQSTDPDDRHYLHFALGTAFEQAGTPAEAFGHFAAGNAIRARANPFDPAVVGEEVRRSRELLTAGLFAERAEQGCPDPSPIFIVGMPRSGSTLVEQILASHAQIEGTAELPIIPILVRTMAAEHGLDPNASYRELLPRLAPAELARLGEEYLRLARQHRKSDQPFFLDKLPHNWADVGFIRLILPKAKIVDVRRSPMDCCWSNFRLLFAKGHPASDSLEGIAAYYRHYVAMMAHFDAALPGQIHRVIYERLVDDFEPEVRRLLDFLGLPFDPACLNFHSNTRAVATASSQQVRRPLNRQGIGAWRAYEEWLGPLKDAVGDLEETYAG